MAYRRLGSNRKMASNVKLPTMEPCGRPSCHPLALKQQGRRPPRLARPRTNSHRRSYLRESEIPCRVRPGLGVRSRMAIGRRRSPAHSYRVRWATALHRIHLAFAEKDVERTQEFCLRWSPAASRPVQEIVRQQWNFSPTGSTTQVEDYSVGLPGGHGFGTGNSPRHRRTESICQSGIVAAGTASRPTDPERRLDRKSRFSR